MTRLLSDATVRAAPVAKGLHRRSHGGQEVTEQDANDDRGDHLHVKGAVERLLRLGFHKAGTAGTIMRHGEPYARDVEVAYKMQKLRITNKGKFGTIVPYMIRPGGASLVHNATVMGVYFPRSLLMIAPA